MRRAVACPAGAWPLEMRAETAAAYCDEPSVEAFHDKVRRGVYPSPARHDGSLPKWHRQRLDAAIAARHGLRAELTPLAEDVASLI